MVIILKLKGFHIKNHLILLHIQEKKKPSLLVYAFNALTIFYNALLPVAHLQTTEKDKTAILD